MMIGSVAQNLILISSFFFAANALIMDESEEPVRKSKRHASNVKAEEPVRKSVRTDATGEIVQEVNTDCSGFPRNVSRLAFYHVSKCGGTNLLQNLRQGGLTQAGNAAFIGEFENSCQKGNSWQNPGVYHEVGCKLEPDTYVMSAIRNPYGYYVSYWQMLIVETQRKGFNMETYGCIGPEMKKRGLLDAVQKGNENNRTSFARFLSLFIEDLPKTNLNWEDCALTMGSIYKRLLLSKEGSPRYDDMMVMEDSWSSILRVLRRVECLMPGTLDMKYLEKRARDNPKGECNNKKKDLYPYHCFYNEASQRLVEEHDKIVLERHGYSFEQFSKKAAKGSCANVVA